MSIADRWHKSRPLPGEKKCTCRPAKVPTAEHGIGMRWQVRYRDEEGKQRKENFETEREARRRDAEVKASLDSGTYINPEKGETTLREYSTTWLLGRTCDPNSRDAYERALRLHIFPVLGKYSLQTLSRTPSLIQQWIANCKAAPTTVRDYRVILTSVFDAAISDGYIMRNPCRDKNIKSPRREKSKVVPLTDEQSIALIESIGFFALLGICTGLRRNELLAVGVDDFDWKRGVLHVRRQLKRERIPNTNTHMWTYALPKGQKVREVPVPYVVSVALERHLLERPTALRDGVRLVFHRNGHFLLPEYLRTHIWVPNLKECGIPITRQYGVHVLRHTFASILLARGLDIRTLSHYLGHDDPGFTLRTYTHFLPDADARARRILDRHISPGHTQGTNPSDGRYETVQLMPI